MSPLSGIRIFLLLAAGGFPGLSLKGDAPSGVSEEAVPVVRGYLEAMGGTAALERIQSIRLNGVIRYPDGTSHPVTVLKKKPDRVRVTVKVGSIRVIQAYDGTTAWVGRESGRRQQYARMSPDDAEDFILEAPLENPIVDPQRGGAWIRRAEDVVVASNPCYQLIAEFPDGASIAYYVEKATFLERRIIEYDSDGNELAEIVPGKFENHHGVLFAMQAIRRRNGETVSTMQLEEIDVNIGILDTAFSPPVPLAPLEKPVPAEKVD